MKSRNYSFIVIGVLALWCVFFTGCGTEKITDYQPPAPAISERTAEESGVELALDPFVEHERTEQYFDINAVGSGIAILHVRVVNKTADQTFLVEKKNFQLFVNGDDDELTADGKTIKRSKAAGEAVAWVGAAALSYPMLFAGVAMVSRSSEIQRNFVSKEMADQTLSPGESMTGFIYFSPVKKHENWSRGATVEVSLTETKTHQTTEFNLPLSQ
jgi:hypothetical protein